MEKIIFDEIVNKIDGEVNKFKAARKAFHDVMAGEIHKLLQPGEEIDADDYCGSVCISYDGEGNDYASNMFSTVNRVFNEDGIIYIDTDDCTVEFEDLDTNEQIAVLEYVVDCISSDNGFDEKK
jgi:hypothetical protein